MYLVSLSTGELRLEKPSFDDATNSFSKIAKWTVLDAANAISRRQVYIYDEVVLKSPFGSLSSFNLFKYLQAFILLMRKAKQ